MLSIIVPIYNVEQFLPRCIESILEQTYTKFELILVDDGSPDSCAEICDLYDKKDNRVVVIHQKNSGVSAARNAGLEIAKGKYIGFVDPDDFISIDMYEKMIHAIEKDQTDMVVCGYDYYDEQYCVDEKRKYQEREREVIDQGELMKRMSDMPPTIRHGVVNKLFKRELVKSRLFPVGLHSSEDVFFLNEYIKDVGCTTIIHKALYKNLVRQGSATHGGLNIQSLADSFYVHEKMYLDIIKRYPELKNHSQAFLLDVCMLKYNEAKLKLNFISGEQRKEMENKLKGMKKVIRENARKAIFNREIYWKTRIAYLVK